MTSPDLRARLRRYALGLPEAYEEHPWGERAIKVRKKIFLFLGVDESPRPIAGLKLVESRALGLAQPGVEPMGYNLGRSGWVTIYLDADTPYEMLREWIYESYRAVAPKALGHALDAGRKREWVQRRSP